jgi:hypothetical protein
MPNTVIMVWMQDPLAGLGDLLRGTMYLCELSQQLKFRLIVDTQLHPVSHFLISNSHEYSDYVRQNKHQVINLVNAVNSAAKIKEHVLAKTDDPILLIANPTDNIHSHPSPHAVALIRTILAPSEEFKSYFGAMCAEFKIASPYTIVHLRLGDDDLVQQIANNQKYNALLPLIDAHIHPNDNARIISDSAAFKQYLSKVRPHLAHRIIPTTPVHLSHSTDIDMMKETVFDLFLLMNAHAIKTYTNYVWVSGFVQWISRVFNVPLISMQSHRNSF